MVDEAKFWIMLMSANVNAKESPISSNTAIAIPMTGILKFVLFSGCRNNADNSVRAAVRAAGERAC